MERLRPFRISWATYNKGACTISVSLVFQRLALLFCDVPLLSPLFVRACVLRLFLFQIFLVLGHPFDVRLLTFSILVHRNVGGG